MGLFTRVPGAGEPLKRWRMLAMWAPLPQALTRRIRHATRHGVHRARDHVADRVENAQGLASLGAKRQANQGANQQGASHGGV